MHARVIPIQCKADSYADLVATYEASFASQVATQPGTCGAFLIFDPAAATGFAVNLWDSEATVKGSEASSHALVASHLLPHLLSPPRIEQHEVLVHTGKALEARFARVITLPVPGKHLDAAHRVYEHEYLPLLKKQAGFQGVMWLADRLQGAGWGISFWSSREQMEAADRAGEFFSKVLSRLAVYFSEPTERHYYRVGSLS